MECLDWVRVDLDEAGVCLVSRMQEQRYLFLYLEILGISPVVPQPDVLCACCGGLHICICKCKLQLLNWTG